MNNACNNEVLSQLEREIPRLRRYARFLTRDYNRADDLVQDCLLRAIENIDKWKPGTNLRSWLFVVQKNIFRNDLQRAKKESSWEPSNNNEQLVVPASQEARLVLLEVRDAFFQLSDEHREILLLVAIEGMKYGEAALILDIPVGTVRSRLCRARLALNKLIEIREDSEELPVDRLKQVSG